MESFLFFFKVGESVNVSENIRLLTTQQDFQDALKENPGKEMSVTLEVVEDKRNKSNLMEYYHKVILPIARECLTDTYEIVDDVIADYALKAESAKKIIYNKKTGGEEVFLEDKSKMSKKRLHKFISDSILFLEQNYNARIPDALSWKTGGALEGFTKVGN
jgi:hypothetical protein